MTASDPYPTNNNAGMTRVKYRATIFICIINLSIIFFLSKCRLDMSCCRTESQKLFNLQLCKREKTLEKMEPENGMEVIYQNKMYNNSLIIK